MEQETTTETENNPLQVSDPQDFHAQLMAAGRKLVVVHFHSEQSQPSKDMVPKCKELAGANKDVVFLEVDIEHEDLAQQYHVSMTPTFVFLKDGSEIEVITGANERRLEELVQKLKQKSK